MSSLKLQIFNRYRILTNRKSLAIYIEASTTFRWDPSTSSHFTGNSETGTLYFYAIINNSTSNAHLSKCNTLNKIADVFLVNNLNPH